MAYQPGWTIDENGWTWMGNGPAPGTDPNHLFQTAPTAYNPNPALVAPSQVIAAPAPAPAPAPAAPVPQAVVPVNTNPFSSFDGNYQTNLNSSLISAYNKAFPGLYSSPTTNYDTRNNQGYTTSDGAYTLTSFMNDPHTGHYEGDQWSADPTVQQYRIVHNGFDKGANYDSTGKYLGEYDANKDNYYDLGVMALVGGAFGAVAAGGAAAAGAGTAAGGGGGAAGVTGLGDAGMMYAGADGAALGGGASIGGGSVLAPAAGVAGAGAVTGLPEAGLADLMYGGGADTVVGNGIAGSTLGGGASIDGGAALGTAGAGSAFNPAADSQLANEQLGLTPADTSSATIPSVTVNGAPTGGTSLSDLLSQLGSGGNSLSSGVSSILNGGSGSGSGSSSTGGLNLTQLITGLNDAYQKNQAGNNMLDWLKSQQAKIDNLYNPGSPEYNALWQQMSRNDAAAGRNSQYGPRSVDLAAKIAQIKADNTAKLTSGIAGNYSGALNTVANANSLPGLAAALGQSGTGGTLNMSSILNYLQNSSNQSSLSDYLGSSSSSGFSLPDITYDIADWYA